MNNDPKFAYGYDVNVYLEKAAEKFKTEYHYHWAAVSLFDDQVRYAIEEIDGEYHYVSYTYFSETDVRKQILDVASPAPYTKVRNAGDFIRRIVADNEYEVMHRNKKTDTYRVQFRPFTDESGWSLERYEFNRLQTGDYSVFVQAGDRFNGSARDFFIPPEYLKGTFEEFLDKYETLVPGRIFGVYKEDLIKDEGLKEFLGCKK